MKNDPEKPSGSPTSGEPDFLVVGRLGRPHGIHGEIAMEIYTDFPERITAGTLLYVGSGRIPLRLKSLRPYKNGLLVSFDGYEQREAIGVYSSELLEVPAAERPPLPEGEYYQHQLLNLSVIDDEGLALGTVIEILTTGANDVYVVRSEAGKEILLPAIDSVIKKIDLNKRLIRVHLLPGLLPEE
jgi:16S rRNA processing protein RimM